MSKPGPIESGPKVRALRLATHASTRVAEAEAGQRAAMRYAAELGASLREIEAATGVPRSTVQRLLLRGSSDTD